jgi:hypothetical protein
MPLSTFLNGRTPTTLRGLLFLSLSDSAIIQKRTATSDSGGGASWVWASTGTVSCRVYPAGGAGPSIVGGALDEATTHFCRLPLGRPWILPIVWWSRAGERSRSRSRRFAPMRLRALSK